MGKINLYIDFDDVVIKSGARVEERLNEVYKWASASYCKNKLDKLNEAYEKRLNIIKNKEEYIKNNFFGYEAEKLLYELFVCEMNLKTVYNRIIDNITENIRYREFNLDYVLEVLNACEKYYNESLECEEFYIDFDKLLDVHYVIDDAFAFIKNMINEENVIPEILSHKNCERECQRKIDIIRDNVGNIPIHLLSFHKDPFSPVSRSINSKAKYIMEIEEIDKLDNSYILIDDSRTNIREWNKYGGKGILYSRTPVLEFKYQMQDMTLDSFYNCLSEEQLKLIKKR